MNVLRFSMADELKYGQLLHENSNGYIYGISCLEWYSVASVLLS